MTYSEMYVKAMDDFRGSLCEDGAEYVDFNEVEHIIKQNLTQRDGLTDNDLVDVAVCCALDHVYHQGYY